MKLQNNLTQMQSEEDVKVKCLVPLFESLGILANGNYNMEVPVKMQEGRTSITKFADIVVYDEKKNPNIVIEVKKTIENIDDEVIAQLDSYAFWLPARYGIVCNGKEIVIRGYLSGNQKIYLLKRTLRSLDESLILDALNADFESRQVSESSQRVISEQSETFSSLLKDIHQDIRDVDHLDPTSAFDGWSKLLFMKIHEEKWTSEHSGKIRLSYKRFKEEKDLENGQQYILQKFEETKKAYPNIFGENSKEELGLSLNAIEKILKRLDGYTINEIPMDVKGKAYEIFLSSTFRGKGLGQFFTPRQVVDFIVDMVDINYNTKLLDPACGSGGFLIKGFLKIREKALAIPDMMLRELGKTKKDLIDAIKNEQIFGVDAEPRATKTAKMNMIMWGDGENVVRGNGLFTHDISGKPYVFQERDVSLILANPPFGNKEKDEDVLALYDLYNVDNKDKTELLFIERAIKLLKPEGELAIVIPDGILVAPSLACVRDLIYKYATIKSVVSLPKHTFTPSGVQTISTSVLYIKKNSKEYLRELESSESDVELLKKKYGYDNYNIFMGVATEIGYEPNGKPTKTGRNDLVTILQKYNEAKNNDFYSSENFKDLGDDCLIINYKRLSNRVDARYYWFSNKLSHLSCEMVPLKDYIDMQSRTLKPQETDPSGLFSLLSVTNDYGVIMDDSDEKKFEVLGSDFTKAQKQVKTGDIVYNPYRINVGSVGIVNKEYNDFLISPAYKCFTTKNGLDSQVLCSLLKNDFYNLYIDIIAIGTIRTSLTDQKLKSLYIPKTLIGSTETYVKDKYKEIEKLKKDIKKKEEEMQDYITQIIK